MESKLHISLDGIESEIRDILYQYIRQESFTFSARMSLPAPGRAPTWAGYRPPDSLRHTSAWLSPRSINMIISSTRYPHRYFRIKIMNICAKAAFWWSWPAIPAGSMQTDAVRWGWNTSMRRGFPENVHQKRQAMPLPMPFNEF